MKVLLIYNPVSGHKAFVNYLDYVINRFQSKGYELIPFRMGNKSLLFERLNSMNSKEYKKILIAGGDGTINVAINYMIKCNINLPIAIFPVGTANDFAHYYKLPKTIEKMTDIALSEKYTFSDIGMVNNKYFINVTSLGSIITISQKTDTNIKNNLGLLAYYLKGIEELPNLKAVKIEVKSNEKFFLDEIYFLIIMNGRAAGGFKKVAPNASMNDGLLDVIIFKKCPLYEFIPLAIKVLNGEHIKSPWVTFFQTQKLTIDCDDEVSTDIDGEKGSNFPLKVEAVPNKIIVNIP